MIYANDQWLQMPSRDLYDTQMMQMALNTAKDTYEKGQQEIKDFNTMYGDFMTPIFSDQDKYNNTVTNPVKNVIDAIYAAGGDPLRNPEARALITRAINSIDRGEVAKLRQRAQNANEYYKNLADLRSKGLYNEDFSNFLKENPNLWDENSAGVTSPTAYMDLNARTSPWFDKVNKNAYLYTKDGYDYFGITPEDLKTVMTQQMPDFVNTDYGRYQLHLAGGDIEQLKRNIVDANKAFTINPTRAINPERKMALEYGYDAALENLRHENAKDLQNRQWEREDKMAASFDIWDEARGTDYASFTIGSQLEHGINPPDKNIKLEDGGDYDIPKSTLEKLVKTGKLTDVNGRLVKNTLGKALSSADFDNAVQNVKFEPRGNLVYNKEDNSFYITGFIYVPTIVDGKPDKDGSSYKLNASNDQLFRLKVYKTRGIYTEKNKNAGNSNNYGPKV